ncbi:MAG TPA: hypothetical protein VJU61_11445, partial [Polyangiaceae bacterium]|nr:hypothetical protein [Polyangiaceae bacterium]
AVNLAFEAEGSALRVERMPASPEVSCAGPLLRVTVKVTLSSERGDRLGTWQSQLYAESPERFAGVGSAPASELEATLLARAGSPSALRLTYEMVDGQLQGWLSVGGAAARVVAEF